MNLGGPFYPTFFNLRTVHSFWWCSAAATFSQLSTIEKKGAFLLPKIEFSPSNPTSRKSLQVLRFSHHLVRLFVKKLKGLHKKNIFSILLLAIILLPLKYPIWLNSKLRQFSHFLQQINKSKPFPFSKIQTRAHSLFPFVR